MLSFIRVRELFRKCFYRNDITSLLLASMLFSSVTFLFIPLDLYFSNHESTNVEFVTLLKGAVLPIITVMIVMTIIYFGGTFPLLRRFLVSALGTVAVSSWFLSVFLFGNYGQIDGRGLEIETWSLLSFFQILFVCALFLIIHRFMTLVKLNAILISLILISLLTTTLNAFHFSRNGGEFFSNEPVGFSEEVVTFSRGLNVIHFLFDELQGDVLDELIKSNEDYKEMFEGFTHFPDTASNYPTTEMSIPAILTGRIYDNYLGGKKEFLSSIVASRNTLPAVLEDEGYSVSNHGGCNYGLFENCSVIGERTLNNGQLYSSEYLQLLDLALFRVTPDVFKNNVYNDEAWLIQKIWKKEEDVYAGTSYVGLSHKLFSKYNEQVKLIESEDPTYRFFHSLMTHSPIWLNAQCMPLEAPGQHSLSNRMGETACALSHLSDFINKLKKLGIYDNTLIIVSSDHGSNYRPAELSALFPLLRVPYSSASSSLMIKPINSSGPFRVDRYPASLSDISATILDAVGVTSKFPGIPLLSHDRPEQRVREFLDYKWHHSFGKKDALPPTTPYGISADKANFESWEKYSRDEQGIPVRTKQEIIRQYAASEFETRVGTFKDSYIEAIDGVSNEGILSYGPYITPPKGHYRISVQYDSDSPTNFNVAWWDIVGDFGEKRPFRENMYGTNGRDGEVTTVIEFDGETEVVEVRVYYKGSGDMRIHSINFERLQDDAL
ncbi:sulfatase-like hydrolase/transferase [Vibrio sp. 10N.261.46.E11]|uniref:sulfatase-like hydrolase/transferase n=1 Tax=Vibrio sp. 10N.261.46.E11 TaxID=3229662 RepID=UPI003553AA18